MGRDVISLRDIDEQSGKHPLKSFKAFIWDRADQQPAGEHRRGGDKPPQDGSKVNDKQEPDVGMIRRQSPKPSAFPASACTARPWIMMRSATDLGKADLHVLRRGVCCAAVNPG